MLSLTKFKVADVRVKFLVEVPSQNSPPCSACKQGGFKAGFGDVQDVIYDNSAGLAGESYFLWQTKNKTYGSCIVCIMKQLKTRKYRSDGPVVALENGSKIVCFIKYASQ